MSGFPPHHPFSFFHENLKAFIKCNSASDALLAPLVLRDNVDIDLFNAFLSIVHDPTFNPKDVTFRTTGDILVHIAMTREDDMAHLVHSNANSELESSVDHPPQIPPIVVEFAIDTLRDEMMVIASDSFLRGGKTLFDLDDEDVESNQKPLFLTLLSCSLVHSSWLPLARRAAGIFLQNVKRSTGLRQLVQNPCFGQWTRSLHLKFYDSLPHSALVASLFDRIPNITFLALDVSHALPDEDKAYMMSEHISHRLRHLEEFFLFLHLPDTTEECQSQDAILAKFLAFPGGIPTLKSLRLSGFDVVSSNEPPYLSEFKLLSVAPNLTHFYVQFPILANRDLPGSGDPVSLSWVKDTDTKGAKFVPNRLHYWITSGQQYNTSTIPLLGGEDSIYPVIKILRLDYCDRMRPLDVTPFIRSCSSITTLELCLPYASQSECCGSALKAVASLPKSAENVHIFIQFFWPEYVYDDSDEPKARFECMDEQLADGLASLEMRNLKLRALILHLDVRDDSWEDDKVQLLRFPRSTAWCRSNSLLLEKMVEITTHDASDRLRFRVE